MKKITNLLSLNGFTGGSVLLSWILSYCLVFFTSLLLSGGLIFVFQYALSNQIREHNSFLINLITKQADKLVEEAMITNNFASFNKQIQDAVNNSGDLSHYDYFSFFEIQNILAEYGRTPNVGETNYIYLIGPDKLITKSQTISTKDFFIQYYGGAQTTYEEWIGYLSSNDNVSIKSIEIEGGRNILLCIKRLIDSHDGNMKGSTVSVVDTKPLDELILESEKNFEYAILDQGAVLASSEGVKGMLFEDFIAGEHYDNVLLSKNGYFYQYKVSPNTSITYVALIEAESYYKNLTTTRQVCIGLSFIILLITVFIIIYTLSANYIPLKTLVEEIKKKDLAILAKDEYDMIEKVIKKLEQENLSTILELEAETQCIRKNILLNRLLKGSLLPDENEIWSELRACGIEFPGDHFAVMIIEVKDFSGLFIGDKKTPKAQQTKTVRYVIKNVTEELCGDKNNMGFLCDLDKSLILLYCFAPENVEEAPNLIMQTADFTRNFFKESLSIDLTIAISNVYKSLEGINIAYREALEVTDYNMLLGTGSSLYTNKFLGKDNDSYYRFTFERERLLLNYIRTGDKNACQNLLTDMLLPCEEDPSIEYVRCLAYDMVATMLKLRNDILPTGGDMMSSIIKATDSLLSWITLAAYKKL